MTTSLDQLALPEASPLVAGLAPQSAAVRDWEIVRWIARMGAVTLGQVRARFGLGRTAGYRRVAACVEGGLLERVRILHGQPALLRATRRGLRYGGVRLPLAQISADQVGHWIACADVALELEAEFGADAVRSEREIRLLEREAGRPIGSCSLGERPEGGERLHRADLIAVREREVTAVEVELTPKGATRLEEIVRGWRRARWVGSIRYYAAGSGTAAGLERAIAAARAAERVSVHRYEPGRLV
jgi:hypothetical protein